MNMSITSIAALAAITLLTPASLMAQDNPMGQMGMDQGEMTQATDMPMMQAMAMRPGPRMLLAQREALDLSDAQVERLEELEDRLQATVTEHREDMVTLRDQLTALRESEEMDIGQYETLLEQAADRRIAMQVERARIGQEAFDVLDDEQRSNVRYGMRMQRMMMQPGAGMGSGNGMTGMMGGGMMGGQAGAMMDHGRMMAMMQSMQQRMQQMRENCPALSDPAEN